MKHCVLNWQVRNNLRTSTYTFTGILLKRFNSVVFISDESIPIIDVINMQQKFDDLAQLKNLKHKILAKEIEQKKGFADVIIIVSKNSKRIDNTEKFLEENSGLLGDVPENLNGTIKIGESKIYRMPTEVYDRYAQNI